MTMRPLGSLLACLLLVLPSGSARGPVARTDLELGISGSSFTVNSTPQFLVFVSYFDAFDVSQQDMANDFYWLKQKGVDGIRIFPNWWTFTRSQYDNADSGGYAQDTLIDSYGNVRSGVLDQLLDILDLAKDYELIVDISFSVETVGYCPGDDCYDPDYTIDRLTKQGLIAGISEVAEALSNGGSAYKHVLLDLQNEYNLDHNSPGGTAFSNSDIEDTRDAVKAIDSHIIVAASISSDVDAWTAGGRFSAANVDVAAWHEDRGEGFQDLVADAIDDLHTSSGGLPVYLQEPVRMTSWRTWLDAEDFAQDLHNAYTANPSAAAWCFHNSASHWLNGSRLYNRMTSEERAFVECIHDALDYGMCSPSPTAGL